MGKKKPFIDKKRATTYYLTYRNAEQINNAEDETERGHIDDTNQSLYSEGFDDYDSMTQSDFLMDSVQSSRKALPEERRKELIALGFPDDGYDYLRHMRVLGHGNASIDGLNDRSTSAAAAPSTSSHNMAGVQSEGATGPSVFIPNTNWVPPTEDVKLHDARALQVRNVVEDEAEVEASVLTSAGQFSRETHAPQGKLATELQELEQSMVIAAAPEATVEGDEWGDWLDGFVLTASQTAGVPMGTVVEDDDDQEDEEDLFEEESEEDEEVPVAKVGGSRRGAGALPTRGLGASRGEAGVMTDLEERFEHLASAYDDDELGGLADAARARGNADISDFRHVLDDFLEDEDLMEAEALSQGGRGKVRFKGFGDEDDDWDEDGSEEDDEPGAAGTERARMTGRRRGIRAHPDGIVPGKGEHKVAMLMDVDADVIAITKARCAAKYQNVAVDGREAEVEGDAVETILVVDPDERWDCESVLSLRTNTEHHPARIIEPSKRKGMGAAPGLIQLSTRGGLPKGYTAPAHLQSAIPESVNEESDEDVGDEVPLPLVRPAGETPEERKARKAAVKQAQRSARASKREVKAMFKEEGSRQRKMAAGKSISGTIITIP